MEYAIEVGFYSRLPILHREFGNWPKDSDAGVIDQNVKLSQMGIDELEQFRDLIIVFYIGGFALYFTCGFRANFANGLIDGILAAPADRNARAFHRQHPRDRSPDSTSCAGHQTYLSIEGLI